MKLTQPIRNKAHVQALLNFYHDRGHLRNYLLLCLGVYTALRISDILSLTTDHVYDFKKRKVRTSITIVEKKTGKHKSLALHKTVITALALGLATAKPGQALIRNTRTNKALSRVQAWRIIRAAAESLKLPQSVSCHSLRKTFGYHAWKDGTPPVVIMEIYNHSSLKITKCYLGVSQDDKDAVYVGLCFAAS